MLTHISHPTLCSSLWVFFVAFLSPLVFSLPLCSNSPHLCVNPLFLSHPCSILLLFLHTALFSLIGLHLFLYPPSLQTDTAEGISFSLTPYLCHCSLFPPLYVSFSLFVSLRLYLYLPPSLPPSPSHPLPSLSLHAHLIHFTHYGSIHHFSLWRKNLLFLIRHNIFRLSFLFPTPTLLLLWIQS